MRQIANFYYEIYRLSEWIEQLFKMAAGRHFEYFRLKVDRITGRSGQIHTNWWAHYGFWMYMTNFISYKLNRFYEFSLQYNSKWLLDAILNILVLAIIADFRRNTHIRDFNKKVYAIFHFCTMHFYHMKKTIMGNGSRTPSWISYSQQELEIQAIDESSRTSIRRYMPNFTFILWNIQILWKK